MFGPMCGVTSRRAKLRRKFFFFVANVPYPVVCFLFCLFFKKDGKEVLLSRIILAGAG